MGSWRGLAVSPPIDLFGKSEWQPPHPTDVMDYLANLISGYLDEGRALLVIEDYRLICSQHQLLNRGFTLLSRIGVAKLDAD